MIIPRYLGENGTIGVTAPSFGVVEPLDILRFDNAEKLYLSSNLETLIASLLQKNPPPAKLK